MKFKKEAALITLAVCGAIGAFFLLVCYACDGNAGGAAACGIVASLFASAAAGLSVGLEEQEDDE